MTDEDVGPATSFQSALVRRVAIHEIFWDSNRQGNSHLKSPLGQFIKSCQLILSYLNTFTKYTTVGLKLECGLPFEL
jgi:hypothetical protein